MPPLGKIYVLNLQQAFRALPSADPISVKRTPVAKNSTSSSIRQHLKRSSFKYSFELCKNEMITVHEKAAAEFIYNAIVDSRAIVREI